MGCPRFSQPASSPFKERLFPQLLREQLLLLLQYRTRHSSKGMKEPSLQFTCKREGPERVRVPFNNVLTFFDAKNILVLQPYSQGKEAIDRWHKMSEISCASKKQLGGMPLRVAHQDERSSRSMKEREVEQDEGSRSDRQACLEALMLLQQLLSLHKLLSVLHSLFGNVYHHTRISYQILNDGLSSNLSYSCTSTTHSMSIGCISCPLRKGIRVQAAIEQARRQEPFRFSFLMPSKGGEADYPSGTDSFTVDSDVGIGNVFFDPFPCA